MAKLDLDDVMSVGGHAPEIPRCESLRDDPIHAIVKSYDSLIVRLYSMVRFTILRQPFLEELAQYLPRKGTILDFGCGFGLFSLYFAAPESGRWITGVDLDARRITMARKSAGKLGIQNVRYEVGDVLSWHGDRSFDAIYMLDIIHHLPPERVPEFLAKARALLRDNGIMVLKDVAPTPRYKMLFTLLMDRLMVGNEPIRYWPPSELSALLTNLGFQVVMHRMTDILPYPHILYVCRLGEAERD